MSKEKSHRIRRQVAAVAALTGIAATGAACSSGNARPEKTVTATATAPAPKPTTERPIPKPSATEVNLSKARQAFNKTGLRLALRTVEDVLDPRTATEKVISDKTIISYTNKTTVPNASIPGLFVAASKITGTLETHEIRENKGGQFDTVNVRLGGAAIATLLKSNKGHASAEDLKTLITSGKLHVEAFDVQKEGHNPLNHDARQQAAGIVLTDTGLSFTTDPEAGYPDDIDIDKTALTEANAIPTVTAVDNAAFTVQERIRSAL